MGLVTSLVGKLKGQYQKLAGRYGPGWAMAIMGSGQAVGWGTTAVGAAMGVPLVIPGLSILGSLPAIGLAELHRALSGRGKKPTAPGAGGAGTSLAGAGESPGAVSHLVAGGDVQASAPARLDPVQAVVEALHRAGGKAAQRDLRPHLHQLGITGPAEQHQAMEAAVAAGAAHAGGTELRLPAVGSEAAAPAQDLAALVAEAARLHGGDVNLAPCTRSASIWPARASPTGPSRTRPSRRPARPAWCRPRAWKAATASRTRRRPRPSTSRVRRAWKAAGWVS